MRSEAARDRRISAAYPVEGHPDPGPPTGDGTEILRGASRPLRMTRSHYAVAVSFSTHHQDTHTMATAVKSERAKGSAQQQQQQDRPPFKVADLSLAEWG